MATTPSDDEPSELEIAGVEAGYASRIRSVLKGEAPYVFAKRAGIGKSYMYEVLGGTKAPSLAFFSSIAETAGVRSEWLISGRGMPNASWNGKTALIPRLEISEGAVLSDSGTQVLVDVERLAGVPQAKAAAINAPDDGVAPLIEIGDSLIVELNPAEVLNGSIYLIRSANQIFTRRVIDLHNDEGILLAGCKNITDMDIEKFSVRKHFVLARVAAVYKNLT